MKLHYEPWSHKETVNGGGSKYYNANDSSAMNMDNPRKQPYKLLYNLAKE